MTERAEQGTDAEPGETEPEAGDGRSDAEPVAEAGDRPPQTTGADATRPEGRTALVVAGVLAVVFFVSTVVLGVVAAGLKADKDELADGRAEVADTASRFVQALLSYDHRDPEGFRERVLALTAPPFTEQFEAAVTQLEQVFAGAEAVSVPAIEDVFVAEVGEGTATAIVVYDRVLDGLGGRRTETNLYVRIGLVERDEGWRVNDVVNLNLAIANAEPGG